MLRCQTVLRRSFRVEYRSPRQLPVPCAQRWDLRLAKAKLWQEHIDPSNRGVWQLEDERHMSPEFSTFTGYKVREMLPSREGFVRAKNLLESRLPNGTCHELFSRRDVPFPENLRYGKTLYDVTFHGTSVPYLYRFHKMFQRASRNDRKLKGNKFNVMTSQGSNYPPPRFTPWPEPVLPEAYVSPERGHGNKGGAIPSLPSYTPK